MDEQALSKIEARAEIAADGVLKDRHRFMIRARQDVVDLLAEVRRLRGLTPAFPPFPPDGDGLPRYGIRWNGPGLPLAVPMEDGYWVPWHLAIAAGASR